MTLRVKRLVAPNRTEKWQNRRDELVRASTWRGYPNI